MLTACQCELAAWMDGDGEVFCAACFQDLQERERRLDNGPYSGLSNYDLESSGFEEGLYCVECGAELVEPTLDEEEEEEEETP